MSTNIFLIILSEMKYFYTVHTTFTKTSTTGCQDEDHGQFVYICHCAALKRNEMVQKIFLNSESCDFLPLFAHTVNKRVC